MAAFSQLQKGQLMRFHIVTDKAGNIVAAAHASAARESDEQQSGFVALLGQTIAEVDIPLELSRMEPHDRLRSIFKYRVHADGKRLEPVTGK
jgi:hypothetical protein